MEDGLVHPVLYDRAKKRNPGLRVEIANDIA